MNTLDVVRRIRAYEAGKPLPRGEKKRFHLADDRDILIVAFVRMGGESRPWGIAFGHPGTSPHVLSVPEARNRDLVAGMATTFTPTLLRHLRCPGYTKKTPQSWEDLQPLRQVWLTNESHLEMLHHLSYAYTFTRWGGDQVRDLNALGRACGWMFREAQRPGEMSVMTATSVLRGSFTFPAEDIRQGHLGYLLAWLGTKGGLEARLAAATEAERLSTSTSLEPQLPAAESNRFWAASLGNLGKVPFGYRTEPAC